MSLLRGTGSKSKFKFTWYKQKGGNLAGSSIVSRASDYEDSLEVIDRFYEPESIHVTMREVLNERLAIGVFESRPPGQTKNIRKTLLLEIRPSKDQEGKHFISVVKDLTAEYNC